MSEATFPSRFRCGAGPRVRVELAAKDEVDAKGRRARLRVAIDAMVKAGRAPAAAALLEDAAKARLMRDFAEIERAMLDAASKPVLAAQQAEPALTFREVCRRWLSNELHQRRRKEVAKKGEASARQDWSVLNNHVLPALGDKPVAVITRQDCERVKEAIPESASYRRVCTLIRRPLLLAEQFGWIERCPVGAKFVPPEDKPRVGTYLYPDEDRAYLGCRKWPLVDRCAIGFGSRNGSRPGELALATVGDYDRKNKTFKLDENKTDSPRSWRVEPDSARMLELIIAQGAKPTDPLFPGFDAPKAARRLRAQLGQTPGCERATLYVSSEQRRPICAHHGCRATFVTLALASGGTEAGRHRTEQWVRDRTGHTTDKEMERYRKDARFAVEHEQGEWLSPIDQAIPELRRLAALGARRGPGGGTGEVGQKMGQKEKSMEIDAAGTFPSPKPRGDEAHAYMSIHAGKHDHDAACADTKTPLGPPGSGGVGQTREALASYISALILAGDLELAVVVLGSAKDRASATLPDNVRPLAGARKGKS